MPHDVRRRRRKRASVVVFLITGLLTLARAASAQQPIVGGARSADGLWQAASDQAVAAALRRQDLSGPYAVAQLNRAGLDALLAQAPLETDAAARATTVVVITLPLPDGGFARFRIEESPILAPELAVQYPAIKTYRGSGLDDPTATARLDVTPRGFHAMIASPGRTVYVDPYTPGDLLNHVAYDKSSLRPGGRTPDVVFEHAAAAARPYNQFPIVNGTVLRTYRLALAATYEYTVAAGGTKAAALSRMTTSMNRVNGIYERELAVRMTLATGSAGDPTALIHDSSLDPYTNDDGVQMLTENQVEVDAVVGPANYDIGHVFSTGGGGVAYIGAVCASFKAGGVTGLPNPVGDVFDVDYVAHEMGHQFAGNHTFNGTDAACSGGTRSASHAYEVGSGSTIQGYAGICASEDTQQHSSDFFNFESLNEMTAFITSGGGATCGTATATGNSVPVVTAAGATFTIPAQTPFTLTASGSDANGDTVTYIWEQHDLGTASNNAASASSDDGSRPLFRSYSPTTSPSRTFPSLTYVLNNTNQPPITYNCSGFTCLTGEVLPSTGRTMTFHVTARDNRAGGGAINTAETQVVVNNTTGPFSVTAPNTNVTLAGNSPSTVSWAVMGSNALAANVRILLSTDGGNTFPTVLLASTANDGTEAVTVPNTPTATARIKVEAVGNIFFDISDTNFTIVTGCAYAVNPTSASYSAEAGGGTFAVTATPGCGWTTTNNNPSFLGITGGSSGTGNGVVTYTVAANAGSLRSGSITVNGSNPPFTGTFTVNQAGCAYSLSPTATTFGGIGGIGQVAVQTTSACGWSVTGIPVWASTLSGGSGTGSGVWQYSVAANAGAARNTTVTVAGQAFALAQLGNGVNPKVMTAGTRSRFTLADDTASNLSVLEAVAGRSYCAGVAPDPGETSAATPAITILRADNSTTVTTGTMQACFVAPATETMFVRVTQAEATARAHSLQLRESTLWANWFFASGGYSSFTLLRNTTTASVNVAITWRSTAGAQLAGPLPVAIPAGGVVIYDALTYAGAGTAGSVEVGHDGDVEAIVGSQTTLAPTTGLSFDTIAFQRVSPPW